MLLFGVEVPLWAVLLVIVSYVIYRHSRLTFNTFKEMGIPSLTPSWIPYIGCIPEMLSKPLPVVDVANNKRFPGKIYGAFMGRDPVLMVADAEIIKEITIKQFQKFRNHRTLLEGEHHIHTQHVGVVYDDHWKHVRSTLTPAFTSGKLKQMFPVIMSCADKLTNHIKSTSSEPFDIKSYTSGYTMDVIASTAFGMDLDTQKTTNHPFVVNASILMGVQPCKSTLSKLKGVLKMMLIMLAPGFVRRFFSNYCGFSFVDYECAKYFEKVVNKVVEDSERAGDLKEQKNFISMCSPKVVDLDRVPKSEIFESRGNIWTTAGLTKTDFIANASIFIIAGYETTATALQFFLYSMAVNPQVQEKLYEEVKQAAGDKEFTYEQLQQLEYLERCINESLRIFPPVLRLNRESNEEAIVNDHLVIPKDIEVHCLTYAIHHDPDYWPEPETFNPDRFAPENRTEIQQYAFLPFGAGGRSCIANRLALLEIKVAVVKLITTFIFEKVAETPEPVDLKFKQATGFLVTDLPLKISAVPRTDME